MLCYPNYVIFQLNPFVQQAVAFVKQRLDHDIKLDLTSKDLTNHISIVTGGNSGTGFAVAKKLVSLGSTVVLACRNEQRCQSATKSIQEQYPLKRQFVIPMNLDLSDLASVKKFSVDFQKRFKRLDILVNNAGLISDPGALTAQGLEESFGAMHIGHFALTKYLLKLLLKPLPSGKGAHDAARVINLSSDGLFLGNFHPSLMTGSGSGDFRTEITDNCGLVPGFEVLECCPLFACPNTNGYARAKLANTMHAYELQRRVDDFSLQHSGGTGPSKAHRRLVTASLHPGSVNTNIHAFLSSKITAMFLRSSDQAAHVILHAILDDSFVPSAFIDAMRNSHDLFSYRDNHLYKHTSAFPAAKNLPFFSDKSYVSRSRWTLHGIWWNNQAMIQPTATTSVGVSSIGSVSRSDSSNDELMVQIYRKDSVAARLWDVSEQIVSDWEARRPLFNTNVSTTTGAKLKL